MDYRALPKIDLHVHLDGALRPSTVADFVRASGDTVPHDVEARCRVRPDCRSLPEFLATFSYFLPYLGSTDNLRRAAREVVEDQHADGVVYFETRFAPTLWLNSGFAPQAAVEAALAGLAEGTAKTGVRCGLILCGIRNFDGDTSIRSVDLAYRFRHKGVVGVDLAGDERHPAVHHSAAFDMARRLEIPITCHAGEAGPAANVLEAIDLGASRIGHGVRAADDPAVVARSREATFEMCLTSNLQTRSVASLADHPFAKMLRDGVKVTLNTDDPGVQGSTLSQDYALAERAFDLKRSDFHRCLENAIEAAFVEDSVKAELRRKVLPAWNGK